MLRDVGHRITSVEELIATSKHDKEVIQELSSNSATELNLLTQLYEQFTTYRNDVNKYEPLKSNYYVMAMIETLSYDVLAVDPRTNKTFDITIDNLSGHRLLPQSACRERLRLQRKALPNCRWMHSRSQLQPHRPEPASAP